MNFALPGQHDFGFTDLKISGNFFGPKAMLTVEGGFAVKLTNVTGSVTIKGQVVEAGTSDLSFKITEASDTDPIGIVYEAGVANGEEAWIVWGGMADVAMKDDTAATRGNWLKASDEAGYCDNTVGSPPGADPTHWQEVGHSLESVSAAGGGTHILARCAIHFN